jgi:hypothetical protein
LSCKAGQLPNGRRLLPPDQAELLCPSGEREGHRRRCKVSSNRPA